MLELKALAINTKAIRIKKKETQLTFGLNCGLSEDEICNIENQNTDPKLSTIQSIATYTGLTVSDLLKV
jgi:hypothetical protein